MEELLKQIFDKLLISYGFQEWWPGEGLEIAIGAVLTQQTNWNNVEKALSKLRDADCLSITCLKKISLEKLEQLIKSSGYYKVKAQRLKNLIELLSINSNPSREDLLEVKGIGYETADSILLYLFEKLYFVIDSYTFRIIRRMGIYSGKNYLELQRVFIDNLPKDIQLYKEYHALLVKHAKGCCLKNNPKCDLCPLKDKCIYYTRKTKIFDFSKSNIKG